MKNWFNPNEKKKITITFGNLTATFEGMSVKEVLLMIDKFRETFPKSKWEKLQQTDQREAE